MVIKNMSRNQVQREKLPHEIPSWVEPGARYFITIACKLRDQNVLAHDVIANPILQSIPVYENLGYWYVWLLVIMPDHLHGIISFDLARGIRKTVSEWKRFMAREHGIKWQSDFFEHRLRNDMAFVEKANYIRMNPVRRGLVTSPEQWPYIYLVGRGGNLMHNS